MTKTAGMVYLIGAGPGDAGLITVRGAEILSRCDVVIYDALVQDTLIAALPAHVQRVFVGKRGGSVSVSQDVINRKLAFHARAGRSVARLKGGDPLVFGRGSEEMEYLRSRVIDYEVVPGVSSAFAAPAWAGIPVTHRDLSRSVAVVTGHLKAGSDLSELVLPKADTLVFLMAMQNLEQLVPRLIKENGLSLTTPAAIVRNGTCADQQVVCGTLKTIAALKARHAIGAPAVLVVGASAALATRLAWFRRPPLAGVRVVVLRTPEQSSELVQRLSEKGASVVSWPIISIKPRAAALRRLDSAFISRFTMAVFTSPNGVRLAMDALRARGLDARCFAGIKVYVPGEATAQALAAYGIIADGVPKLSQSEGVLRILSPKLHGERIVIVCATAARSVLADTLTARGAAVTVLPVYKTVRAPVKDCPVCDGDFVVFTSSSTAEFFFDNADAAARNIIPCCIGQITSVAVASRFRGMVHVARRASAAELVSVVQRAANRGRRAR